VIADLSVNHVERFILEEGHTVQRVEHDYGYDLILFTHDGEGQIEPGFATLQLKASETLAEATSGKAFAFDMAVEDYNLWTAELMPVFLVLYDATRRRAYWLDVQHYFNESGARRPRRNAKTVRVYVPRRQAIHRRAIAQMRARKQQLLGRPEGATERG
jgi:hypothetical protein